MKCTIAMVTVGALLTAIGSATAGPCTTEIEGLQKIVSSSDAGMGPTNTGTSSNVTSPSNTTAAGETPKAGEVPGTEATAAMNEAVEGKATSADDVQKQNQGEPTAADAAKAGETAPAAGASPAMTSIQRATELDKAGNEAECMAEVQKAKQLLGTP